MTGSGGIRAFEWHELIALKGARSVLGGLGNKSQKSTFLKIFSTLFCYFLENVLLIPTIAIKVAKKLDVISTGLMDLDLFPRLLVANLSSC